MSRPDPPPTADARASSALRSGPERDSGADTPVSVLTAAPPRPGPDDEPDTSETGPAAPGQAPAKVRTGQALRLLAVHLRPRGVSLAAGLTLLALATVVGLGLPMAVRFVLDALATSAPLTSAVQFLVVVVIVSAVLQGAGNFLLLRSAEDVVLSSRQRLINRLLSLSLAGMRRQAPGDLMARVTSDTALVRQIANASVVPFVTGSITVTGAMLLMILMDPFLFLTTVAVIAVPSLMLTLVMPRVRRASQQTQTAVGAMGSALERVLGAYSTVKAAAAEADESERLGLRARRARDSGVRSAFWTAVAVMTSALAVQAAFLVVLGMGAYRVQNGTLTVAVLIAFLLYAMQLAQPTMQLTQAVSAFQSGRAALERIAEVDRWEREADSGTVGDTVDATTGRSAPMAPNAPGGVASLGADRWTPAVELVDATFTYPGSVRPAVDGLSLSIPPTGVTAIVGPSGSGKSTVLKLVEGFFPLDSGQVRVAGRDLGEWSLGELRTAVALVEQETPILAGTLRANLVYGLGRHPDDARVLDVLEHVGLGARFSGPEDLDQDPGHRGGTLSGGERQRIAIARAILRNPTVLLLDEATSQLDAANEQLMREVVAWLGARTAVVLVAHRLSTVVDADQVVLMQHGRLRALGRHSELVASDEVYRSMVEQQSLQASTVLGDIAGTPRKDLS